LPTSSDAVGSTTEVQGEITLDGASNISVDLSTLTSEQDRRDDYIRDNLFQTEPNATFVVDNLTGLPDSYTEGDTEIQTVTGTATIRGVTGPLTFEVEARLRGSELHIVGRTDFTWADFQIPPPNTPLVTVEDNVHIEVLLIARATT
jgi:polyisoprenoid-binding protein YceI